MCIFQMSEMNKDGGFFQNGFPRQWQEYKSNELALKL